MTTYRTKEGDVVDAIAKARLGSEAQASAILDLNPGLAGRGAVLPAGIEIILPEAVEAPTAARVRLWGTAT